MTRISLILTALLLCAIPATQAQQPVNTWSDAFAPAGTTGHYIAALTESDSRIYVSGAFFMTGSHSTSFAVFDTINQEWSSVGNVTSGSVQTLAAGDDGMIYVGGTFQEIGSISASNVAWYNPHTDEWGTLGSGLNSTVYTLAVSPAGDLYAAGPFTASGGEEVQYLARWDGENWVSVGNFDDSVFDLAFEGDFLYVAGRFTMIDEVESRHVASFDTATMTWSALGGGVDHSILSYAFTLAVNEESVFVSGLFDTAIQPDGSTIDVNGIARWDPVEEVWSPLGEGTGYVTAMALGPDGFLYVPGGTEASPGVLRRWNGTEWHAVVPEEAWYNGARSVQTFLATEKRLIVGFELVILDGGGGEAPPQVLYWYEPQEDRWGVYGNADTNGLTDQALAFASGPDPGTVYAGGFFRHAGTEEVNRVAYWNGTSWESLGRGVRLNSQTNFGQVNALHPGINGMLYIGGEFHDAIQTDGTVVPSRSVAAWDPAAGTWHALGQGVNSYVQAIAQLPDGTVYVGGQFTQATQAGGEVLTVSRLVIWNTATGQWEAPPEEHGFTIVFAMDVDASGALIVAGRNSDGGRVIRLDPQSQEWTELRAWPGNTVNDIAVFGSPPGDGALFAALAIGGVWQWHNDVWSNLGGLGYTSAVAIKGDPFNGGELYAGGHPPGVSSAYIQRLQGSTWYDVGEGLSGSSVRALAVGLSETEDQTAIWVGGHFIGAGGMPSVCIARWETISHGPISTQAPPSELGVTLQVYPNPAIDRLMIAYELEVSTSARVVLYDLLGRELFVLHDGPLSAGSGSLTSDVERLPSGMYVVRMTTDDGRHTLVQRVTVVR